MPGSFVCLYLSRVWPKTKIKYKLFLVNSNLSGHYQVERPDLISRMKCMCSSADIKTCMRAKKNFNRPSRICFQNKTHFAAHKIASLFLQLGLSCSDRLTMQKNKLGHGLLRNNNAYYYTYMTSNIALSALGYRCSLFTSPAFLRFCFNPP